MSTGKILVVDDDINICELLRLYIEKEGYQVIIANDGNEALRLFESEKPDFVMPWSAKMRLMEGVGEAKMPIIRCSTEVYSSPIDFAAFSAAVMIRLASEERYTSAPGPTFGRVEMAESSSERTALQSTPIFPKREGISPPS